MSSDIEKCSYEILLIFMLRYVREDSLQNLSDRSFLFARVIFLEI